jgi:hypothetical protein
MLSSPDVRANAIALAARIAANRDLSEVNDVYREAVATRFPRSNQQ